MNKSILSILDNNLRIIKKTKNTRANLLSSMMKKGTCNLELRENLWVAEAKLPVSVIHSIRRQTRMNSM